MQKFRSSRVGRLAAAAATAVIGATLIAAPPSQATQDVTTSRVAGNDRFATAAAVATAAYPSGADTVIVASGVTFPDALAGAALAGRQSAPVLLTEQGKLSTATSSAIDTLKATKSIILGGTGAVSQAVQDELAKKTTVSRIAGTDRFDTAAKIAVAIGSANIGSTSGRRSALIATGSSFADALAGGALAAAGAGGVLPVLLVSDTVPASTEQALKDLQITQTVILGGTAAVSEAVAAKLKQITGNDPTRIAGANRFATATAIASNEYGTFGFDKTNVVLANGVNFADALAGGPYAGKGKWAVLLTEVNALPDATKTFLGSNASTIAKITALGGVAAVSDATLSAAEKAAEVAPTGRVNESIVVTPQDDVFVSNSATRTYTAEGIDVAQVDIVILECKYVSTNTAKETRFTNSNKNAIADHTARADQPDDVDNAATTASISQVNGAPNVGTNGDYADDATVSNGKVTFVVSGPTSGTVCVRPVVFADANSNDALTVETTSSADPTEKFGTGGEVEFVPNVAAAGSFENFTVSSSDDGNDLFVACHPTTQACSTFFYDSGDDLEIDGEDADLDDFEETLSEDDKVSGTYNPNGASTIDIIDDAGPAAPSILNVEEDTDDDVTLTFSDSGSNDTEEYDVLRAEVDAAADCDTLALTAYDQVGVPVEDDGNAPTVLTHEFVDTTSADNTIYCYVVRAIAGDDPGPASDPASADTNDA